MKHVIDEVGDCCAANCTDKKEHDTFVDKYFTIDEQVQCIYSHKCPTKKDRSAIRIKQVSKNAADKHMQLNLNKMDSKCEHGWFGIHCWGQAAWGVDVGYENGTQHKHVGAVGNETG